MKMNAVTAVLVLATIFSATSARELPDFLHVCQRKDPNLGECIKNSVESFKPYLHKGLPEYNIPTLEPLFLQEVVATSGANIKLNLMNVRVHGASNFNVVKLKANADTLRFLIELDLPMLTIDSDYEIDGKILLLRIQGTGPLTGNFTNCKGLVKIQGDLVKGPDGQTYMKIVDLKTKIAVGGGSLKLDNLFGGDPVLGEAVNSAINSNFDTFIDELKPALETGISDTFIKIANSILLQFTYEVLFPLS
ncbi:circadian clock-controlled protein daywake [Megachile rotundata]|uniref:circadian clock-controlled protein daywake n=1 Tax=Megachile rotundata TaxID=143995 RepID=UPI000614FEF6|nr:PREDICTED: circadian clock-controlled protein [Megachile rotundata]